VTTRISTLSLFVFLMGTCAAAQNPAAVYDLKATPGNVHRGFFDASLKPVLKIDSGSVVRLETSTGNPRYFEKLGVPKEKIPRELYAEYDGVDNDGRGDHTLRGMDKIAEVARNRTGQILSIPAPASGAGWP
jgi:hypothetical protein